MDNCNVTVVIEGRQYAVGKAELKTKFYPEQSGRIGKEETVFGAGNPVYQVVLKEVWGEEIELLYQSAICCMTLEQDAGMCLFSDCVIQELTECFAPEERWMERIDILAARRKWIAQKGKEETNGRETDGDGE